MAILRDSQNSPIDEDVGAKAGKANAPTTIADIFDVELAWRRVKVDFGRNFVRNPYEERLVEVDLAAWLDRLHDAMANGRYAAQPVGMCDMPKRKGAVRPGALLSLEDRVAYAACVGACLPMIAAKLNTIRPAVDFNNRLAYDLQKAKWLRPYFTGYKDFQTTSLRRIDDGAYFVVFTDVSAFYEYIDIERMISYLKEIECPEPAIKLLSSCLNRWATVRHGIPQGYAASDILAKLYLHSLDETLISMNVVHVRYTDDFRFFCTSMAEARRVLVEFVALLRDRGLTINSAKTDIFPAARAKANIRGSDEIIDPILRKYIEDVRERFGVGDPYINTLQADALVAHAEDEPPVEVIRAASKQHIIDYGNDFDAHLFSFLLSRLAGQGDTYAVGHCTGLLTARPEETGRIVEYLVRVKALERVQPEIEDFLDSADAVYPYQVFLIMEGYAAQSEFQPSPGIPRIARRLTFGTTAPAYLRSMCRKLIADYCGGADLERLGASYANARDALLIAA